MFKDDPIITTWPVVQHDAKMLPVIRICPFNWVNGTALKYASSDIKDGVRAFWGYFNDRMFNTTNVGDSSYDKDNQRPETKKTGSNNAVGSKLTPFERELKRVALNPDAVFKKCYSVENPIECSTIVRSVLDGAHGICYDVEFKEPQEGGASIPPLRLIIDLNSKHLDNGFLSISEGIEVMIQGKTASPLSFGGLFIPPGSHSMVELRETELHLYSQREFKLFGASKQSCIKKSPNRNPIFNRTLYDHKECEFECQLLTEIEQCGCMAMVDTKFLVQRIVYSAKYCQEHGGNDTCRKTPEFSTSFFACAERCLPSCFQTTYDVSASYSQLSELFFAKYFTEILAHEAAKSLIDILDKNEDSKEKDQQQPVKARNHIVLDVKYSALDTIQMVESPSVTWNTFLSNVGGQLGLWIGASIFTFVQILVFGFDMIKSAILSAYHRIHRSGSKNYSEGRTNDIDDETEKQ